MLSTFARNLTRRLMFLSSGDRATRIQTSDRHEQVTYLRIGGSLSVTTDHFLSKLQEMISLLTDFLGFFEGTRRCMDRQFAVSIVRVGVNQLPSAHCASSRSERTVRTAIESNKPWPRLASHQIRAHKSAPRECFVTSSIRPKGISAEAGGPLSAPTDA